MIINIDQLQMLLRQKDWDAVYTMLDGARDNSVTAKDTRREVYWRGIAFEKQKRYQEALHLLQENAHVFNSQSLVQHQLARILLRLGRDEDALDELSKAPFEEEMRSSYGLAIDAKFLYFYLMAKKGDESVKNRLSEIPDEYQHITMDGTFLTKPDILAVLNGL